MKFAERQFWMALDFQYWQISKISLSVLSLKKVLSKDNAARTPMTVVWITSRMNKISEIKCVVFDGDDRPECTANIKRSTLIILKTSDN